MWKLLFKILLVLALAAGIGNYLIYLKTGQFPLSQHGPRWKETLKNSLQNHVQDGKNAVSNLPDQVNALKNITPPALVPKNNNTQAYKWVDKQGVVHYSDQPPTVEQAQMISINPDTNIIQGTAPATAAEPKQVEASGQNEEPRLPIKALEPIRRPAEIP
jgi:hypothetical protein